MIKERLVKILKEELLLPIGATTIIIIMVFSFLHCLADTSREITLCKTYGEITGEKVVFTEGDCYKYLGYETFEKVVFKGVE